MAQTAEKLWTVEEFLVWEAKQPTKHEFINGEIVGMTGAARAHGRLVINISALLHSALRGTPCEVLPETMQVHTQDMVAYPDIVVTCEPSNSPQEEYVAQAPRVLIEVQSRSTQGMDHGPKWEAYQTIPSLEHYILVAQERPFVEMYSRRPGKWDYLALTSLDHSLEITAIGVTLPLREIYDRVFPAATAG